MRDAGFLAALLGTATVAGWLQAPHQQPLSGSATSSESLFLEGASTESMSAIHRQVTEHPHTAGSSRSMQVADRVRRALDAAGLQTESVAVIGTTLDR